MPIVHLALQRGIASLALFGLSSLAEAATLSLEKGISTIESGTSVQAVLTLAGKTDVDLIVPIVSSNETVAAVPASIRIPAGSGAGSFRIKAAVVSANASVNITATVADKFESTKVPVKLTLLPPPGLASVSISPTSVIGGTAASVTVTLQRAANHPGVAISLSSGVPTVASTPTTVLIGPGRSTGSVTVTTQPVTSKSEVNISARNALGKNASAMLVVNPPAPQIASMSILPVINATNVETLAITLSPVPTTSAIISLSSSNQAVLTIAPSIQFNPGDTMPLRINVISRSVTVDTPVILTATTGSSSRKASVTVRPLELSFSTPAISVIGGTTTTGTLAFNLARNSANTVIGLSATGMAAVSIPSSVTLPARATGTLPASQKFDILTQPTTTARSATITAALPADIGGGTRTISFNVLPLQITALQLAIAGCDISLNCPSTIAGTLTLNGPAPAAGAVVSLASDLPDRLSVPASVMIPAGELSALFTATLSYSADAGLVTITATAPSGLTRAATLQLSRTFVGVASVSANPSTLMGGTSTTVTVTVEQFVLSGRAGALFNTPVSPTQISVPVRFYAPGQSQPFDFSVPAGQSTATFPVSIPPVAAATTISIQAGNTLGVNLGSGRLQSAQIAVQPATLVAIDLPVNELQSGLSVDGAIRMTGPVPPENPVIMSSDSPEITIRGPTFRSGATQGAFRLTASSGVTSPVNVTLTAAFAGQTLSRSVIVARSSVLASVSWPADRLLSSQPTMLTIALDGPAPAGGAIVALSSSNVQALIVPSSIVIPAGQTAISVPLTPQTNADSITLSVGANYRGISLFEQATIERLRFGFATLPPSIITGGDNFSMTLAILNNGLVAPVGGFQLTTENFTPAVLSVPETVTIPAGQTSVVVPFQTHPVAAQTTGQVQFRSPLEAGIGISMTVTP